MAEIRRMLTELKSPATGGEAPAASSAFADEPDPAGIERMAPAPEVEQRPREYHDPLREKLLEPDKRAATQNYERDGLMRRHVKRSRRKQLAEKSRKSRSGFVTGFLLVALMALMLAGIYAFHPQIIARMPGTEPALREYVAAVDEMRRQVGQQYDRVRVRVLEIVEELTS
jgi:hypothetical protein